MSAASALRSRAAEVACTVAARLSSARRIADTMASCASDPSVWSGPTLFAGHPGIALLHATLSDWDQRWAGATHDHLTVHLDGRSTVAPDRLVALLPAALVHRGVHRHGYGRLLATATGALARTCLADVRQGRRHGVGLAMAEYDVIVGLAGKGRLLLALADREIDGAAEALAATLEHLVHLTEPVTVRGARVPGWWCSPERYLTDEERERYPLGDFNIGLAHGIAGPLALLSLAHRHGHRVPGMLDAISRITDWLLRWGAMCDDTPAWPARIDYRVEVGTAAAPPEPGRKAWCYGTPGVARAVQLAAEALGDGRLAALAVNAHRAVVTPAPDRADLTDLTLCHGAAGLLRITHRMAAASGDPALDAATHRLAELIVTGFDPEAPFGYRHTARPGAAGIDKPGLLYGAAGIALALASYAHPPNPATYAWDSTLLLG